MLASASNKHDNGNATGDHLTFNMSVMMRTLAPAWSLEDVTVHMVEVNICKEIIALPLFHVLQMVASRCRAGKCEIDS